MWIILKKRRKWKTTFLIIAQTQITACIPTGSDVGHDASSSVNHCQVDHGRGLSHYCAFHCSLHLCRYWYANSHLLMLLPWLLGKQLYSEKYKNLERLAEMDMDRPPKWNFTDFIFSFLMVWSYVTLFNSNIFYPRSSASCVASGSSPCGIVCSSPRPRRAFHFSCWSRLSQTLWSSTCSLPFCLRHSPSIIWIKMVIQFKRELIKLVLK